MAREFGIYPANTSPINWWGARAIIVGGITPKATRHLELLWDRQNAEITAPDEKETFFAWVDRVAIPRLNEYVCKYDTKDIEFSDGKYHCKASDRDSGGYLYIGVWSE